ncbi:MAG: phosphohydrolase [Porphyromonadaceae bacterium]|nr:MAG: phosphohydrolase [Porphyromonadaceae bacterium]
MDPVRIITKYYQPESLSFRILLLHSQAVARKAIEKAKQLNLTGPDIEFIREASMLHDIGIFYTSAPEIGCFGDLPYICHGFKGHNLLLAEGLPKHALVCERHTGTGLTLLDIDRIDGLLPRRPMEPISLAEKLITYCDKFFFKDPMNLEEERPFEEVLEGISKFGEDKSEIFKEWHRQFNP